MPEYEIAITQVYLIEAHDEEQARTRAAEVDENIAPAYSCPGSQPAPHWLSDIQDSHTKVTQI